MDRGVSILKRFEREIAQINRAIEEIIEGDLGRSSQLLGYAALSEGKRIRPLLFLMSCRALGKDSEEIYIQSTAYELIHVASLLHDDVLDNAELRRNRPTVNAIWGNHLAVLGGDNLYVTALKVAAETGSIGYVSLLIETVKHMTEGQILELQNSFNYELDKGTYMEIIQKKTASLIAAALKGAGIFCQVPESLGEALHTAGLYMGVAFQMMDDLLDITGNQGSLGKEIGKDIKEGKVTLPLIYLLQRERLKEIEEMEKGRDPERMSPLVEAIRGRILQDGIANRIKGEAQKLCEKAEGILRRLPNSPEKGYLLELNRFIVMRDF